MIVVEEATYHYPGALEPALRGISLTIPVGQFCALVGPNGAGKSTLAYVLVGFIPHFFHGRLTGSISVAGRPVASTPLSDLVQVAGLVLQNPFNQISGTKFTVREEIAFGLENLGLPRDEMYGRIAAVLDLLDIRALADRSPLSLSGGQMQRVALASVLAMRPPILILDEPTAQLDPVGSREVFAAISALARSGETTVVVIEHKLEWIADYAERVLVLAEGALVADGPPGDVLAGEALLGLGVGNTRYTLAARRAQERGAWPEGRRLAVTLDEAVAGLQAGRRP